MIFFHNNTDMPKTVVELHWHDVYEILFIRRGWGEQKINSDTFPLHPGDVVIIRPGDIHSTVSLSLTGCDVDVVQFSDAFLHDSESVLNELHTGVTRIDDQRIYHLFNALKEYRQDDTAGQKIIMGGLVRLIIGLLVNACQKKTDSQRSSAIEAVCTHIEQAQDLRLEQVAAHFGYSSEHLSRKFHKETGVSYRSWCERIRMQRAIKLLTEKNRSISDIADMLRYSDESSFIRAFKRMYGITPSVFRRRKYDYN